MREDFNVVHDRRAEQHGADGTEPVDDYLTNRLGFQLQLGHVRTGVEVEGMCRFINLSRFPLCTEQSVWSTCPVLTNHRLVQYLSAGISVWPQTCTEEGDVVAQEALGLPTGRALHVRLSHLGSNRTVPLETFTAEETRLRLQNLPNVSVISEDVRHAARFELRLDQGSGFESQELGILVVEPQGTVTLSYWLKPSLPVIYTIPCVIRFCPWIVDFSTAENQGAVEEACLSSLRLLTVGRFRVSEAGSVPVSGHGFLVRGMASTTSLDLAVGSKEETDDLSIDFGLMSADPILNQYVRLLSEQLRHQSDTGDDDTPGANGKKDVQFEFGCELENQLQLEDYMTLGQPGRRDLDDFPWFIYSPTVLQSLRQRCPNDPHGDARVWRRIVVRNDGHMRCTIRLRTLSCTAGADLLLLNEHHDVTLPVAPHSYLEIPIGFALVQSGNDGIASTFQSAIMLACEVGDEQEHSVLSVRGDAARFGFMIRSGGEQLLGSTSVDKSAVSALYGKYEVGSVRLRGVAVGSLSHFKFSVQNKEALPMFFRIWIAALDREGDPLRTPDGRGFVTSPHFRLLSEEDGDMLLVDSMYDRVSEFLHRDGRATDHRPSMGQTRSSVVSDGLDRYVTPSLLTSSLDRVWDQSSCNLCSAQPVQVDGYGAKSFWVTATSPSPKDVECRLVVVPCVHVGGAGGGWVDCPAHCCEPKFLGLTLSTSMLLGKLSREKVGGGRSRGAVDHVDFGRVALSGTAHEFRRFKNVSSTKVELSAFIKPDPAHYPLTVSNALDELFSFGDIGGDEGSRTVTFDTSTLQAKSAVHGTLQERINQAETAYSGGGIRGDPSPSDMVSSDGSVDNCGDSDDSDSSDALEPGARDSVCYGHGIPGGRFAGRSAGSTGEVPESAASAENS